MAGIDIIYGVFWIDELRLSFFPPPMEFRTVPFWVWNDQVTHESIDEQIEGQRDGRCFCPSALRLITESLSQEWFDLVRNRGIVTPRSLKHAPETQPPGTGYGIPVYGLMNDFQLIECER